MLVTPNLKALLSVPPSNETEFTAVVDVPQT